MRDDKIDTGVLLYRLYGVILLGMVGLFLFFLTEDEGRQQKYKG